MGIISIFVMAVALAMDAFAVSLTIGINTINEKKNKMSLKAGLYFGIFQGIMPLIGWVLGIRLIKYIESIDHWIAFILLAFLGVKMIYEAIKGEEEELIKEYTNKEFMVLGFATSVDALAAGLSLACVGTNILLAVLIIGVVTFVLSYIGVELGEKIGEKISKKAELLGGLILVFIGVKILIEHLLQK